MLTVKHVTANGENVWEAQSVNFEAGERATVTVHFEDGLAGSFDGGVIYVMNRHGATVAKYTLSTREMPMGAMPAHVAAVAA